VSQVDINQAIHKIMVEKDQLQL